MAIDTKKWRWILIAAILVSLVGMFFSKTSGGFHWSVSDPGDSVPVLIADRYIPVFTVIKPELVRVLEFPKGLVPPGALRAKTELHNENEQMLFTSAISIPEGQPITRAFVADAAQNETLGSLIRPGKVAVSFEIDKAHGVGGWIRPGDTVALFGPVPMEMNNMRGLGKKTRLLLSSVAVVAIDDQRLGQNQEKSADSGTDSNSGLERALAHETKIVTVLVSPTDASLIIEAREEGRLSVVLRSLGDDLPWPIK